MTKSILFDNCGKTLASFNQGESLKISNCIFQTYIQADGSLRLEKIIQRNTRNESYTQIVENMKNELFMRRQDIKMIEKDIASIREKIENDGNADEGLTSEMIRMMQLTGQHKKKINQLKSNNKVSLSYQKSKETRYVSLKEGIFTKVSWFPKPVTWCKEIYEKVEKETSIITEEIYITLGEPKMEFLYAVGGNDNSRNPTRYAERYDPTQDKWECISKMHFKRRRHKMVELRGHLYVAGGHGGVDRLSSVERYNPDKNTWTIVAPMNTKRSSFALAVLRGQLYAIGGSHKSSTLSSVERYDPDENEWINVSSMNSKRKCFDADASGNYLYAAGGNNGSLVLSSVERYDPIQNKWAYVVPMHTARELHGVSVLNGLLYVVGGSGTKTKFLSGVERYDPNQNKWTLVKSMKWKRKSVCTAAIANNLYALGGNMSGAYLSSVERYDPLTNTWKQVRNMKHKRSSLAAAVISI